MKFRQGPINGSLICLVEDSSDIIASGADNALIVNHSIFDPLTYIASFIPADAPSSLPFTLNLRLGKANRRVSVIVSKMYNAQCSHCGWRGAHSPTCPFR